MPVVPLLAGLVAVLAVALALLVAAGRRARASMPDDATVSELGARLGMLRDRYAAIADEVSLLAGEAGATSEGTLREAAPDPPQPAAPPAHIPAIASDVYVSTTAPARVRRNPSPTAPGVQASAHPASA